MSDFFSRNVLIPQSPKIPQGAKCTKPPKLYTAFFNFNSDLSNVMDWFKIDSLRATPGKWQFMVLGPNKIDSLNLSVVAKVIPSSSDVKLLWITIDYELKFKKHINELRRKASHKLHALQRIRKYLSIDKAKLLANAFIDI